MTRRSAVAARSAMRAHVLANDPDDQRAIRELMADLEEVQADWPD